MANLARNSVWGGIAAAGIMGGNLVSAFIAIRLLGEDGYGYFAVLLSVNIIFLQVNVGFYTSLVRNIVSSLHFGNSREAERFIGAAILYTCIVVPLFLVGVFFTNQQIVDLLVYHGDNHATLEELSTALLILSLATCFNVLSSFYSSVIEGHGRFDLAAKGKSTLPFVLVTLMSVLLFKEWGGFFVVASVYLIAACIEFGSLCIIANSIMKNRGYLVDIRNVGALKYLLVEGGRLQGAKLINVFVDPANKFILNYFLGPAVVTHYDLAVKAVNGVRNLFLSAFRSFIQISSQQDQVKECYKKTIQIVFGPVVLLHALVGTILAMVVGVGFIHVGDDVLKLYLLLIPMSVAITLVAPLYNVLIGIGDASYIFRLHFFLAIGNLVLTPILVPILGLWGAGIGLVVCTLYNAVSVYKRYVGRKGKIEGLGGVFVQMRLSVALWLFLAGLLPIVTMSIAHVSDVLTIGFVGIVLSVGMFLLFQKISIYRAINN